MRQATLRVDQTLRIGQSLNVSPTDIDSTGVRLLVRGQKLGGPDDGQRTEHIAEVAPGSTLELGPLIRLTLARITGSTANFLVVAPPHIQVLTIPADH